MASTVPSPGQSQESNTGADRPPRSARVPLRRLLKLPRTRLLWFRLMITGGYQCRFYELAATYSDVLRSINRDANAATANLDHLDGDVLADDD